MKRTLGKTKKKTIIISEKELLFTLIILSIALLISFIAYFIKKDPFFIITFSIFGFLFNNVTIEFIILKLRDHKESLLKTEKDVRILKEIILKKIREDVKRIKRIK